MEPFFLFADIPDPDNFMMILQAFAMNPTRSIDIILTIRVVCFNYAYYGDKIGRLTGTLQNETLMTQKEAVRKVLDISTDDQQPWIRALSKEDQQWFTKDALYPDQTILAHSLAYHRLSIVRLGLFLRAHGIDLERANIYASPETTLSKIRPGLRHHAHKRDWAFDFDEWEREDLARIDAEEHGAVVSEQRGERIMRLCREFVDRVAQELRGWHVLEDASFHLPISALVQKYRGLNKPVAYGGGPFTELLEYIEMGGEGFIDGAANIFTNQFNILVDIPSALTILSLPASIPKILIPTEVAKGSPYALDADDMCRISPAMHALFEKYYSRLPTPLREGQGQGQGQGQGKTIPVFDYLVMLYRTRPVLFTPVPVNMVVDGAMDGEMVVRFERVSGKEWDGKVSMCWNAPVERIFKREEFLKEVESTFSAMTDASPS
ncbi:MAG: hypothetical protein M1827_004674 [Pycnora praestabilis]|nr:MAG: hypothetical protein M1827_004674 [Pycnora praestabilis]